MRKFVVLAMIATTLIALDGVHVAHPAPPVFTLVAGPVSFLADFGWFEAAVVNTGATAVTVRVEFCDPTDQCLGSTLIPIVDEDTPGVAVPQVCYGQTLQPGEGCVARLRHQSHPTYAFYPFYRARAELVGAGVGTIDGRLSLKTWPDDATIGVIVNGRPVPTGGGN